MSVNNQTRPDPDALLQQIKRDRREKSQGRLKIFFGAAPGVGKTYAMLEEAHRLKKQGIDVVIGWLDTHGRKETEQLVQGLEQLAPREGIYRNTQIKEFDLDAALQRNPTYILVDELAHTNAPSSRHPKRFQDVLELLDAGIHVYTTLNVQHLESVNDIVSQITYVRVQETLPDAILEQADEVELIDLPPEELLERLSAGKVYVPAQAELAASHFFRKGNLLALRELALRYTADHVDKEVQQYRKAHGISNPWNASERILVCVGPNFLSERLIRTGKRMAQGLQAPWSVLYVESPQHEQLSENKRALLHKHLKLAEMLGAKVVTLSSAKILDTILDYAKGQNVTKILVGKPSRSRMRELFLGSLVDSMIRESGEIDIYVITGQAEEPDKFRKSGASKKIHWTHYFGSLGFVALATFLSFFLLTKLGRSTILADAQRASILMLYLLAVVGAAFFWGRIPAIFTSFLSVLVFDFFFVEPRYTFAISDARYLLTFAMMFGVGFLISHLTTQVRWQTKAAERREKRTQALYELSRKLNQEQTSHCIAHSATEFTSMILEASTAIFLPQSLFSSKSSALVLKLEAKQGAFPFEEREQIIVDWAFTHKEPAGFGTSTLSGSQSLFLPLRVATGCVGVLGILPSSPTRLLEPETRSLLSAFCEQISLALERSLWVEQAEQEKLRAEKEELHNTLLRSISHDLRTPLAVITGAISTVLSAFSGSPEHKELLQSAFEHAEYLHRLVRNLLDMTRLESGGVHLQKEWVPLEEVVGSALHRLEHSLKSHPILVDLPKTLPLIDMDSVLIEQVFFNLLENISKYTPLDSPIEIRARAHGRLLNVAIADRGPGLPEGTEETVFEKFYHGDRNQGGIGLGLSICRAIISAHGGTISAINRREGGTVFAFTLPLEPPISSPEDTPSENLPSRLKDTESKW